MGKYDRYDNYSLSELIKTLTYETVTNRYFPLVIKRENIIRELKQKNIFMKQDYEQNQTKLDSLNDEENYLFIHFLHLYDFIPRKITEFIKNDEIIINLKNKGIINSGDLLINQDTMENGKDLQKIISICNLMRLPGVKYIRANLYYESGLTSYNDFINLNTEEILSKIKETILLKKFTQSLPFKKEINTQKAISYLLATVDKK